MTLQILSIYRRCRCEVISFVPLHFLLTHVPNTRKVKILDFHALRRLGRGTHAYGVFGHAANVMNFVNIQTSRHSVRICSLHTFRVILIRKRPDLTRCGEMITSKSEICLVQVSTWPVFLVYSGRCILWSF